MNSRASITRRGVLRTASLAMGAAITPPSLITSAKGTDKQPLMGNGEHTYEVSHDWPQLPDTHRFGNTHGIVVDFQGRVIIAHTVHKTSQSADAIAIFDPDGKFIKSWGSEMRGGAHGLTIRKEGSEEFLYHCDNVQGYVRKTTLDGEVVWVMHAPVMSGLYASARDYRPSNLAIAPNGDIYVADGYGKFYIHHYDAKTNYIRSFGGSREEMDRDPKRETGPGTTIWPHAIAIDLRGTEPLLLVGERGANSRIQYFALDGKPLHIVKEGVRWPSIFEFRGNLMLMPDLKSVVTLYDKNNKPVVQLGDGPGYSGIRDKDRSAFPPGKFVAPHGACFDKDGNIFVAEWVEIGRVSKLRRVG